jgi:hypothetical protein
MPTTMRLALLHPLVAVRTIFIQMRLLALLAVMTRELIDLWRRTASLAWLPRR